MIYLPFYDLRNECPFQDLVVCWKRPIRDYPSTRNAQVESLWNAQSMFSLLGKKASLLQSTTVICSARAFIYKSHKAAFIEFVLIPHIPSQMWKHMTNFDRSESDAFRHQCGSILLYTKLIRNSVVVWTKNNISQMLVYGWLYVHVGWLHLQS